MPDFHAKPAASVSGFFPRSPADQIRKLIVQERISAARSLLAEALAADPDSADLASLRQVLAPPRVRRVPRHGRSYAEEFEWLLANAEHYRGRWVAVRGTELLAHAGSLKGLHALLPALDLAEPPLVHHLTEEP